MNWRLASGQQLRHYFGGFSGPFRIFILLWTLLVIVFVFKLSGSNVETDEQLSDKLEKINDAILHGQQLNGELRDLVDEYNNDNSNDGKKKKDLVGQLNKKLKLGLTAENHGEPSLEYEHYRRRVQTNIDEFWNYVSAAVVSWQPDESQRNEFLSLAKEQKRSLQHDMDQLKLNDGYEKWRQNEAKELSDLVQRRLHFLQNPEDCNTARKLVCRLNKGCGYGCQLHHLVYCFILAYASERTLILKSKGWRYHKGGWEEVFLPISKTCLDSNGVSHSSWPGQLNTQVVTLPIIDSLNPRPPQLPLAIPQDLAPRLMKLHGDPIVWWIAQFLKYLLKPQPRTEELLNNSIERLKFQKPIVGVHVRRTDKVGTEAAFHNLDEYMIAVDEYYNQLELKQPVVKRRVFIASDDPKVIEEAKRKYTHYEVIGDPDIAKVAAVSTRYTDASLNGIIIDIHLLSLCDYLVCTFSSQVCRVAYEIMQTHYTDAYNRFRSLDDVYYYGGQNAHYQVAVLSHKPANKNQISLTEGDLIGIAGNHWDGFSKGKNMRTIQSGLYPSFKVNNKVEIAEFPTYPNVK